MGGKALLVRKLSLAQNLISARNIQNRKNIHGLDLKLYKGIGSLANPFNQRPATGPRDQFFRLLGIYFINMELI